MKKATKKSRRSRGSRVAKRSGQKSKKSSPKTRAKKTSRYPAFVLGLVVAVLLLGEGALFMNATSTDWHAGFAMLDMSEGISSMTETVKLAIEPTTFTFHAVDDFYTQAAVATTDLFDTSNPDNDSLMVVLGVNNFYKVASEEMANILDLSGGFAKPWQPQVAGAAVYR